MAATNCLASVIDDDYNDKFHLNLGHIPHLGITKDCDPDINGNIIKVLGVTDKLAGAVQ